MKPLTLLIGATLLLTACGGRAAEEPTNTIVLDNTTTTSRPPTTTTTTTAGPGPLEEVDLVTYLAAMEDVLAGTTYEGKALQSPEIFLATGALFCDQLDSGMTPDDVVTKYIETLTSGSIDEALDDDLAMAGGVIGVGVVTLCPQHLDTLASSS